MISARRDEHPRHVREVVERREIGDVRVVNVTALVPDDGEELFVRIVIDERRVHDDERVVVGPEGGGIERGVIDDENLGRRDSQDSRGRLGDPMDAWELTLADFDGIAEELMLPKLLEEANARLDSHHHRLGVFERDTRLAVERVRVRVIVRGRPGGRLRLFLALHESVEVQFGCLRHRSPG